MGGVQDIAEERIHARARLVTDCPAENSPPPTHQLVLLRQTWPDHKKPADLLVETTDSLRLNPTFRSCAGHRIPQPQRPTIHLRRLGCLHIQFHAQRVAQLDNHYCDHQHAGERIMHRARHVACAAHGHGAIELDAPRRSQAGARQARRSTAAPQRRSTAYSPCRAEQAPPCRRLRRSSSGSSTLRRVAPHPLRVLSFALRASLPTQSLPPSMARRGCLSA